MKRLTNRGYAIWTAAQARRPKKDELQKMHTLFSSDIADTYEKIRAADFYGSQNQTPEERTNNVMRLHAENYRDNVAGVDIVVRSDFEKMRIYEDRELQPQQPGTPQAASLGYTQTSAL